MRNVTECAKDLAKIERKITTLELGIEKMQSRLQMLLIERSEVVDEILERTQNG